MSFLITIPAILSVTIGPIEVVAKGGGAHVTEKSEPSGESLGLKTPTVIVHHGSHECIEQNTCALFTI